MRKVYKGNPNIGLSFLYNTHLGRIILKPLVKSKFVSHLSGKFMDSSLSKIMISSFVKKNNIDLSIYEKDKFDSFNDFFTRKIKPPCRLTAHKTKPLQQGGYLPN